MPGRKIARTGKVSSKYCGGDGTRMRKIWNRIALYLIIPLAIIGLLYWGAQIASEKYNSGELKPGQYLAEYTSTARNITAVSGEGITVPVTVRNTGSLSWSSEGEGAVFLSYHLTQSGEPIAGEGERTALPKILPSGGEATLDLKVLAPEQTGKYTLEVDMVCEGVTWFADQGAEPLKLPMEVSGE